MRTTIRMNEELARRAKRYAERTGRTFTQVVEQAVAELLAKAGTGKAEAKPDKSLTFPVVGNPRARMTDEQYRRLIEEMYEEEAARYFREGGVGHPRR